MLTEIVTIIFFLTPIFLYNRVFFNEKNSNLPAKFFAIWCFLFVFEYIYAGPASHIDLDDQGDILAPFLVFLDKYLIEGNYTHRIMMGVDLIGSYVFGGEFLSFDLTVVRIFPLWIAIFVHQVVTVTRGFFGTYKLNRLHYF